MNIARTAVLALAVLSVTAGRPASAQTFQERWSPIPRADAAEKPLRDQDKTIQGIAYTAGTTASGKPYHRGELTAASRTLPFGTRLRVTDLKSNKSVEVTVTDRGPASTRLILDLSLGAAQQLGIASRGIIQVRAEIIS